MASTRKQIAQFHGITSDIPPSFDLQGFDDAYNWIVRKQRFRTRPGLDLPNKFSPPDGNPALNLKSFKDIEQFYHTLLLTGQNAYMLTAGIAPAYLPPVFNLLSTPTFISTATLVAPGTGYQIDDLLTLVQGTAVEGIILVTGIGGGGAISTYTLFSAGSNYTTATGVPTSGGSGSGATFNITTISAGSLGGNNPTYLPYGVIKAASRVYFSNGSQTLAYVDGSAGWLLAGNAPGSPRFLTVNGGHMIGAYWNEPGTNYPGSVIYNQRVRWSDENNYDQWDGSIPSSTAGVDDITDAPDDITGLSTIGGQTNVYRTNGLSLMTLTGNAEEPFFIRPFSQADKSDGNSFPYSLATWNNVDRFVGTYDVYSFDGTNFTPQMDGRCNAAFFADLAAAGVLAGNTGVRGMITPVLANGYQFLGYLVTIPGTNVAWVQNLGDGSWTRFQWAPPTVGQQGFFDLQFVEQVYTS